MPTTGHRLARRYRRLLLCYPRAYRRERGEEIVGTLLELAPPGRDRPTAHEAVNLIRHGLRSRLGRPASRSIVGWAACTALVCGLFAAALAARAGWETSRPLPDRAEATAIFTTVLPGHHFSGISTAPALFIIYGHPLSWQTVDDLLLGDGGEYGFGEVGASASGPPPADEQHTLALAQRRLHASGWRVYAPVVTDMFACNGPPCDPTTLPTQTVLTAARGDTIMELELDSESSSYLTVQLHRATPPGAIWAGIGGGVLGALGGWLLFGWASRCADRRRPALRRVGTTLFGTTMFLWWLPIGWSTPAILRGGLHGPQWPQLWEWLGQPTASLLFVFGCGSALLGLVLVAVPWPNTQPAPTIASS